MNRRNDYKSLLKYANEDLALYGYSIILNDDDDPGFYKCEIVKNGQLVEVYAENFYEDELADLVNEVWYYIKSTKC